MSGEQLLDLGNTVNGPDDGTGPLPAVEEPLLQRSGGLAGTLHLKFNSATTNTSGDVRPASGVRRAVSFLCIASREVIDVLENHSYYGFFSWCLHGLIIPLDKRVTVG